MKRRSLAFLFSVSLMVQNSFMTVNAVESSMPEEPIEEEENINTVEETENTSEEVQEESQIENVEIDIEDVSEQASVEEDIDSLQQYLDHELLGQQTAGKKRLMKASAGQKLSGYDLVAYTELKRQIEEVAAGTLSSTVFSVSMDAAGLTDQVWTAEDLGVDAIVVDGSVNDESVNKLRTILEIDHGKVVNTLLADLPYDFYWFDKKQGWEYTGFSLGIKTVNNQYVLYVKGDSVFKMTVAQEFASGDYEVNSTVVSSLQASVENARGIVEQHASETDYEKIFSYKDEILNDVSYNHEAADNGNTPYGNPWQVIWVFDNDPDTNVVCEGYAKAFKYLCDMSEFNGDIDCITVTGLMRTNSGGENHMWNIVTMENQEHYLTDITNCDTDTIGQGDGLFMKGVEQLDDGWYRAVIAAGTDSERSADYQYDEDTHMLWDSVGYLDLSNTDYLPELADEHVTGVSLDQNELVLTKGQTAQLHAFIMPENAVNQNITWMSDHLEIADVENGIVTANKVGTAIITVTTEDGGYTASCTVTVIKVPNPVTGITLYQTSMTLNAGETGRLIAIIEPAEADNKNVSWMSSDDSVASVDSDGKVTAINPGSATITAETEDGGYKAFCEVNVRLDAVKDYAYAVLTDEGEMIFFRSEEIYSNRNKGSFRDIKGNSYAGTVYAGIEDQVFNDFEIIPWAEERELIKTVRFADGQIFRPISTANWFCSCSNITLIDLKGLDTSNVTNMKYMFA